MWVIVALGCTPKQASDKEGADQSGHADSAKTTADSSNSIASLTAGISEPIDAIAPNQLYDICTKRKFDTGSGRESPVVEFADGSEQHGARLKMYPDDQSWKQDSLSLIGGRVVGVFINQNDHPLPLYNVPNDKHIGTCVWIGMAPGETAFHAWLITPSSKIKKTVSYRSHGNPHEHAQADWVTDPNISVGSGLDTLQVAWVRKGPHPLLASSFERQSQPTLVSWILPSELAAQQPVPLQIEAFTELQKDAASDAVIQFHLGNENAIKAFAQQGPWFTCSSNGCCKVNP